MKEFDLRIVTPDGMRFDGKAVSVTVTTVTGEIQILASHADYVSALSSGRAVIKTADSTLLAAASGGVITVSGGAVEIVSITFEFANDIDIKRAENARERARELLLSSSSMSEAEIAKVKAKLARANTRISVYQTR